MMQTLKSELHSELTKNILPYWIQKMPDHEQGGFYGRIDGEEGLHKTANKGAVLNARIFWTFSAAYRLEKNPKYLEIAKRAYQYISDYFIDKKNGGIYWELDYKGAPVNPRKQIYAQGFALYGFSEFYRATGQPEALEVAKSLFYLIEKHAYDPEFGGYIEAQTEDWQTIEDMRLSERDANAPKSMNTHLHILEPYTNLLRIWKAPELVEAQTRLIHNFCDHIVSAKTKHLELFFDRNWVSKYNIISYGHDIESAWLLFEAAEVLGDTVLIDKVKQLSIEIVEASYEGLQPDGSMIYEKTHEGHVDTDRHWWIQAETIVGSTYAYLISGNEKYLTVAKNTWEYIKKQIIDKENGEWVWSASADGTQNRRDDKAGFWKCPYHNARMCMELITK
ncbi:cellobiose 2-epimerase [Bacteroidia bacterium]|nr:cellobiose 2-epimerase [Bacteroidia bacterium]